MALLETRPPPTKPAKVGQESFLAAIWAGVAISFVFSAIRLVARLRIFKRLFWDDACIIFAWLLSMLSAVNWQIVSGYMYQFMRVTSGQLWPPPASLVPDTETYYKGMMIVLVFFYSSLWSIKLSFLIFFKRLGRDLTSLRIQWWIITVFTGLSFAACFADTQYWCIVAPLAKLVENCSREHDIYWGLFTLKFNCALDVVTDCLIMTIPLAILWRVRLPWQKKLVLAGLFSLVVITMLFAILRVTLVSSFSNNRQPDSSWAFLWTSLEQNMAIIVGCLGAFRTLFTQDKPLVGPKYSFREASRGMFQRRKPRHPLEESISVEDYSLTSEACTSKNDTEFPRELATLNAAKIRQSSQDSDAPIVPTRRLD